MNDSKFYKMNASRHKKKRSFIATLIKQIFPNAKTNVSEKHVFQRFKYIFLRIPETTHWVKCSVDLIRVDDLHTYIKCVSCVMSLTFRGIQAVEQLVHQIQQTCLL